MSNVLDKIYILLFLVNIESVLLLALVKYMLCSHFTQNCILLYFLKAKNPYFLTKNCWKSSYIFAFILSKTRRNWFRKNLHNSGMVARRKLADPSLNRIFNALLIGVKYILSFEWTNFGLKCLFSVKLILSFDILLHCYLSTWNKDIQFNTIQFKDSYLLGKIANLPSIECFPVDILLGESLVIVVTFIV